MRFILLVALFGVNTLFSQTITGIIISNDDKQPAAFTTILIKGEGFGTVANEDGKFKLTIPPKYKDQSLQFSFLGYNIKEVSIKNLSTEKPNTI